MESRRSRIGSPGYNSRVQRYRAGALDKLANVYGEFVSPIEAGKDGGASGAGRRLPFLTEETP